MKGRFLLLLILFKLVPGHAQVIATFDVQVPEEQRQLAIPVKLSLTDVTSLPDSSFYLVEKAGMKKRRVPFQVEAGVPRMLHWIIPPAEGKNRKRVYQLLKGKPGKFPVVEVVLKDGALTFRGPRKNLLRYHYKTVYPPAGVDTVYKRSGFIHPLWSPRGQELTRINAPDHYHHWGLWNPWTEVMFEGDSVDFWNLARRQGTVRFNGFLSVTSGPVFAEYKAQHDHVVFKKESEKTAIREVQTVRIYRPSEQDNYYIADIVIQLACATDSPVLLLEYRYGGLGLRATQEWNKDNSRILTSEGKTRKEADGSTARWCMVQGAVNNDHAGLVMMSGPGNFNHPEPLRIWPENMNGRGDVFLNFSPTKNRSWLLQPGREYTLRYRFLVFNDVMTPEKAEAAWQGFAQQPVVELRINN
jgi:hypothetical protein